MATTTTYSCNYPARNRTPIQSPSPLLPPSPPQHKQQQSAGSLDSTLSANSRDVIVGEQWLVLSKIGEGSFGEVFEAKDIDTGRHYAIKREPLSMSLPQLKHESIMYDVLAGGRGIPQCQWYGQHDEFGCIVIDLLGASLKELRQAVSDIPLDILVDLGYQMVSILEHVHNRGVVYRDVKPDNFLLGTQCRIPESSHPLSCRELFEQWGRGSTTLYAVDFGLATWWRNPNTLRPYPQSKRRIKHKTGTARYASLNVHRGKLHARRDDIESLGYVLLDLALGSLPWTGIKARNSKTGWDRMRDLKEGTDLVELCAGLPSGLLEFIKYARGLRFSDQPDYHYLRRLLRGSLPGGQYSHLVPRNQQQQQQQQQQSSMTKNYTKRYPADNQEGVFVMDDLAQELPSVLDHPNPARRSTNKKPSYHRSGRYDNHHHKKQHAPPSPPSSHDNKKKPIGWNTHKHGRLGEQFSWGEDRADALWGQSPPW